MRSRCSATATTRSCSPAGTRCCRCCGCVSRVRRCSSTSAGSRSSRTSATPATSIAIGALTRHHDVAPAPLLQEHNPLVSYAAGLIGDPQVRHRGTIGGSLAHGDPASDLPAVLLALDAEIDVAGAGGVRTVAAARLLPGRVHDGGRPARAGDGGPRAQADGRPRLELSQVPPARAGLGDGRRRGRREALERRRRVGGDRAREHGHDAAAGARRPSRRSSRAPIAGAVAAEGTDPPSDTQASAEYRRHLAGVLVRRAAEEATQ